MAYTVGQRLLASQVNNLTPSGNVTVGGGLTVAANAPLADTQITTGTTTSATYTATLTTGTACGLAFVAPLSGKVLILNNCEVFNSGAFFSFCTIRVRNGASIGSGTDFLAASDDEALWNPTAGSFRFGVSRLLPGLTPGSSYNVQQLFRASGGTASFGRKHLIVIPQP